MNPFFDLRPVKLPYIVALKKMTQHNSLLSKLQEPFCKLKIGRKKAALDRRIYISLAGLGGTLQAPNRPANASFVQGNQTFDHTDVVQFPRTRSKRTSLVDI